MAKTFTLTSSSTYGGRKMILTCSQTQDIANNKSTITWKLETTGGSNNYYITGPTTLKINGEQVYYKARTSAHEFPCSKGSTSGTLTVSHNTDGTKAISVSLKTAIYYGSASAKTNSGTWTLDTIPRAATLTSAPDFNDTQNPTINYSNLSGNSVDSLQACISLTGSNADIAYRDISKTGTSYTFNLTDDEKNVLYNATLNGKTSRTVYFYIKTVIGSNTFYKNSGAKTFTITDCEPTISATYEEADATVLTIPNSNYVKGISDLKYKITATAKKGASITSYKAECGSKSSSTASGTLEDIDANSVVFTITDNRGQTKSITKNLTLVNYIKPTINQKVELELVEETKVKASFDLDGKFFNGSFGAVDNSLTIYVQAKKDDADYVGWTNISESFNITPTFDGNTYSAHFNILNLDYTSTYTFQCKVVDKITNAITAEYVAKYIPVFDWGKNDFNFNVPISIEGDSLADFVIETGTASMGSNGTWYWRKWKSGRAECYGRRNYGNMAISTAWGSLYMTEPFEQSLPSGLFVAAPESVDINTTYGAFIVGSTTTPISKDSTGGFRLVRGTSETGSAVKIGFNVIGRWK